MQGADYTFTYTIKNAGMATSALNAAAYYVDQKPDTGHFLGYNITNSLAAGVSQNFGGGFTTAGLSVGQHTVWVGADNWGQVGESNETNNWQSLTFMVTAPMIDAPMGMAAGSPQLVGASLTSSPDLIVGSITAGSSVVQGAAFTFTYLVQNIGAAAALANGAAYYVDQKPDTGHFFGYGITNALAAGASQSLGGGISTAGLSVGQHTLWVAADNWNQNAEGNETNNFTAVNFTVTAPPRPDLIVASITGNATVNLGANFTFSYVVQNTGAAASGANAAAYFVDQVPDTGHFFGYGVTNALAAGASQTLSGGFSTAALSPGQHTLFLAADNWGQVGEGNEANNLRAITFTVLAPDLVVNSIAAAATVNLGAAFTFTYAVQDIGPVASGANAAAYFIDRIPDTGHFLGYNVSNGQGAGTSQTFGGGFSTAGLSAGQHFLWIGADNWNQVAEGNETNNWTSVAFTVLAPDLVVSSITAGASVVQGANFTFNYAIQNIGTMTAGVSNAAYRIDAMPDIGHFAGYNPTNALTAGAAQSFAGSVSTAGLSLGQHTLWVNADVANQVTEGNETNNWKAVTFTVAPPPTFDIRVNYTGDQAYASYFTAAAQRWQQVITSDLPDVNSAQYGFIDDLLITANVGFIDGAGSGGRNVLGQAAPDLFRAGSNLPYHGTMTFDSFDLAGLAANGQLFSVILHEMGHVLGIGSLWATDGLKSGNSYIGTNANNAYHALGGVGFAPVEPGSVAGSSGVHWSEAVFGNELMTPTIAGLPDPLSTVTIGSLQDMGYGVNYAAADSYRLPGHLEAGSQDVAMQTSATQPASTFDSGAAGFDMASAPTMLMNDEIGSTGGTAGFDMASAPTMLMNDEIGSTGGTAGFDMASAPPVLMNDEIGNGSSAPGNLMVLTNYLASAFVTPPGEGMGTVGVALADATLMWSASPLSTQPHA